MGSSVFDGKDTETFLDFKTDFTFDFLWKVGKSLALPEGNLDVAIQGLGLLTFPFKPAVYLLLKFFQLEFKSGVRITRVSFTDKRPLKLRPLFSEHLYFVLEGLQLAVVVPHIWHQGKFSLNLAVFLFNRVEFSQYLGHLVFLGLADVLAYVGESFFLVALEQLKRGIGLDSTIDNELLQAVSDLVNRIDLAPCLVYMTVNLILKRIDSSVRRGSFKFVNAIRYVPV